MIKSQAICLIKKHLTMSLISELLKPFKAKLTIQEFQERLNDFIVKSNFR